MPNTSARLGFNEERSAQLVESSLSERDYSVRAVHSFASRANKITLRHLRPSNTEIFLNISLRHYTYRALFSPLLTQRTESKFVFARPYKVTETLLRYIDPENIPIQYGGFKRENDDEFLAEDGRVSETFVKGGKITQVQIPIVEAGVTVVWDIIVVGWEVLYREEFIPDDEGSYKILIKVEKKLEKPARNSFYIHEPGRLVFTIENRSSKKKTIFYRSKFKHTIPCYK